MLIALRDMPLSDPLHVLWSFRNMEAPNRAALPATLGKRNRQCRVQTFKKGTARATPVDRCRGIQHPADVTELEMAVYFAEGEAWQHTSFVQRRNNLSRYEPSMVRSHKNHLSQLGVEAA